MQTVPHGKRFFKISYEKNSQISYCIFFFIVNNHPKKNSPWSHSQLRSWYCPIQFLGMFTNSVVLKYGCLPIPNVDLSLFLVSSVSNDWKFQILQLDLIFACWRDGPMPSLWPQSLFPDGTWGFFTQWCRHLYLPPPSLGREIVVLLREH